MGDVVQSRQVSTPLAKFKVFLERLQSEFLRDEESFLAVVTVCGFNDWLRTALEHYRCHEVILIPPEDRNQQKTDRQDAIALSELS